MKAHKFCLLCLLVTALSAVGCKEDAAGNSHTDTCRDAEKPENATGCECVEGRWDNCNIEIVQDTCKDDCENIKSGYTCDLKTLSCNCNGSVCGAAELCTEGECVLQKGNLRFSFHDSENTIFEDGSNRVTLNVGLDKAPSADVQISWSYDGGDAQNVHCKSPDNAENIVLNADNWETGVDLTCSANAANHFAEGDRPLSIVFGTSSTDPAFQGLNRDEITLIVHDTTEAKITVTAEDGANTTENGGQAKFRVKLSADPQCTVNLLVSTINADSTAKSYGTAAPTSLALDSQNWSEGVTVTLTGQDDGNNINTSDHHYLLQLTPTESSCSGAFASLEPVSVDVVNLDNDSVSIVTSTNNFAVKEEGETTARVFVGLSDLPEVKTTITATVNDSTICTLVDNKGQASSEEHLVFSTDPDDFRDQYVTVKAVDDNVNTGDRSCSIVLTGSSTDTSPSTSYNGKTLTIPGINIDNDVAAIKGFVLKKNRFCERGILCSAGNTSEIYLATKPLADVTLSFSTQYISGSTKNTLSIKPQTMIFTPENYNVPQTLEYRMEWDHVVAESDTVCHFQMKSSSEDKYYNGKQTAYEVTLVNADTAGITVGNPSGVVVRERTPEKSETIPVKLRTIPSILQGTTDGYVEIIATSSQPDRLGVSTNPNKGFAHESASLHFTPDNWDTEQYFYIYPIDNTKKDYDVSVNVDIKSESDYYKEYKDLKGKATTFTVKDDDISTTKLNIKCTGQAACNQNNTTGKCTLSVSSEPTANEDISVSCYSKKVAFTTHFKITSANNYKYTITDITSAYCGNTFEASNVGTTEISCSGEATNYYASGTGSIEYLYNF